MRVSVNSFQYALCRVAYGTKPRKMTIITVPKQNSKTKNQKNNKKTLPKYSGFLNRIGRGEVFD